MGPTKKEVLVVPGCVETPLHVDRESSASAWQGSPWQPAPEGSNRRVQGLGRTGFRVGVYRV